MLGSEHHIPSHHDNEKHRQKNQRTYPCANRLPGSTVDAKCTSYVEMVHDINAYGQYQNGTYREVEWSMTRPFGTYWKATIHVDPDRLSPTAVAELDRIAHGGLTHAIGFDCAHPGDYTLYPSECGASLKKCTYRDYHFVISHIHKMIDFYRNHLFNQC